ncbi:DUF4377 domain-containing protein [Shewanella sp. AS1]|uniref:DUF4377 domain-containing protein n=1 Tax=Shewanella sp. AS1 TaxID=2907626 RepID=UPI001F2A73B0|nr:DUF4377 domain-containing protein [Shewanella sp. AS1]MCE9680384.1 DUF4377 domain-containing protein [Shewanella sp. AS1]
MLKHGLVLLFGGAILTGCNGSDDKAETLSLSVLSNPTVCTAVGNQLCLDVSGTGPVTAFMHFYGSIEGFTYQWGHFYSMTVEVSEIANPPADGSSLAYTLISIDTEVEDNLGSEYVYSNLELSDAIFTRVDNNYAFYGKEFSCAAGVDCDTLVSLSGSGGLLSEVTFSYLGGGKIQLDAWM